MNNNVSRSDNKLYFSRWNRKGYAIFVSLGREVRIGTLALHICEMSLKKSSRKGMIINLSKIFERMIALFEEHRTDVTRAEGMLLPVMADADVSGFLSYNYKEEGMSVYL